MDSEFLKRQLLDEIKEALIVKELNLQLMEQLAYTGHWILNYCNNNGVCPPNTKRLMELIQSSKIIIKDICEPYRRSDESLHDDDNDESRRRLDIARNPVLLTSWALSEAVN